jgi:hypothetical protein
MSSIGFPRVGNKAAACGRHVALRAKLGCVAYSFDGTAIDVTYKFHIRAVLVARVAQGYMPGGGASSSCATSARPRQIAITPAIFARASPAVG